MNLAGRPLQRVDSYVYLGRELKRNNIAPEITRRRRAAWAAFCSRYQRCATRPKSDLMTRHSRRPCDRRIEHWRDVYWGRVGIGNDIRAFEVIIYDRSRK
ncbi:hypothetical protein Y032_0638g974 [Ancylostoma ceylanicum]|uniref:Uncharacterized protein n=1 Tax=Ancylostoma ceylanicum TaxID=53326 RepID=A0A016WLF7_9BILA|nr:hypothetical protein Y032_0638g974 [Ancylostoma ceylanicum]